MKKLVLLCIFLCEAGMMASTLKQALITESMFEAENIIETLRELKIKGYGVNEYGPCYCVNELVIIDCVCKKAGFPTPPIFEVDCGTLSYQYLQQLGIPLTDDVYVRWISGCEKPLFIIINPFFRAQPEFSDAYFKTYIAVFLALGQPDVTRSAIGPSGKVWAVWLATQGVLGYLLKRSWGTGKTAWFCTAAMLGTTLASYCITRAIKNKQQKKLTEKGLTWCTE